MDFKVRNYVGIGREDKVESIFLSGSHYVIFSRLLPIVKSRQDYQNQHVSTFCSILSAIFQPYFGEASLNSCQNHVLSLFCLFIFFSFAREIIVK